MTLAELSDEIAAANTTWDELAQTLKIEFGAKALARGKEAFDNEQRDFFSKWWLRVTAAQVTGANALLPENVRVTARLGLDGLLYVNADLLADCQSGETYNAIKSQLQARTLVRKQLDEWPEPLWPSPGQ